MFNLKLFVLFKKKIGLYNFEKVQYFVRKALFIIINIKEESRSLHLCNI